MAVDYTKVLAAFRHNAFEAEFFDTAQECVQWILAHVEAGADIGFGGSKTVEAMGLYEKLAEDGHPVHWHWKEAKSDWKSVKERARQAPYYICSANALTEDGKIIQMDGASNRVSAMVYGPDEVFIPVGVNKLCPDLEAARERLFGEVGSKISQMVDYRNPCKKTGRCHDCNSPDRCCRVEMILHKCPHTVRMWVLLIDEELGF